MGIFNFVANLKNRLPGQEATEPDTPRERIPPAPNLFGEMQGQILTTLVFGNVTNPFDFEMLKFGNRAKGDKWLTPEGQAWIDLQSALIANPIEIPDIKKDGRSGGHHDEIPSSVLIHVGQDIFDRIHAIRPADVTLAQHELQEWHAKLGPLYMGRTKPRYAFLPTPGLPDDRIVIKFGTSVYLPDEGEFPLGDVCYEAEGEFRSLDRLPMVLRVGEKDLTGRNVEIPLGIYENQGVVIVAQRMEHSTLPLDSVLPSAWEGALAINLEKWKSALQGAGKLNGIFIQDRDKKTVLQGVEKKDDLIIATLAIGADDGGLGGGNTFRIALRHPSRYAATQSGKARDTVSERGTPNENRVPADADQRTLRRRTICIDNVGQEAPRIRIQAEESHALRLVAAGIGLRKLKPEYGFQEWRMAFDKAGMPAPLDDAQLRLRSAAGDSTVFWRVPDMPGEKTVGVLPAHLNWGGKKVITVNRVPDELNPLFFGLIPLTNGLALGVGTQWNWVGRAKFGYFRADGSLLENGGAAVDLDSFDLSRFHAAFRMIGGGKVEIRQQSTSQSVFICRKNGKVEVLGRETEISDGQVDDNEKLYVEKGEYDIREGKAAVIEPGDSVVLGSYFFRLES